MRDFSVALDPDGRILHMGELQKSFIRHARRAAPSRTQAEAIAKTLSGAGFDVKLSTEILQDMWERNGCLSPPVQGSHGLYCVR